MFKVQVLVQCKHCNGKAYIPLADTEDCQGCKYIRHIPCPMCEGSGNLPTWISLDAFAKLLHQSQCPHKHTSFQGKMHFYAGEVWDDIHEVCDDCGLDLEGQTLGDLPKDEL